MKTMLKNHVSLAAQDHIFLFLWKNLLISCDQCFHSIFYPSLQTYSKVLHKYPFQSRGNDGNLFSFIMTPFSFDLCICVMREKKVSIRTIPGFWLTYESYVYLNYY